MPQGAWRRLLGQRAAPPPGLQSGTPLLWPVVSGPGLTLSFPPPARLSAHPRVLPSHTRPVSPCLAAVPLPPQRPQQRQHRQGWRHPLARGRPNVLTRPRLSLPQPGAAHPRHPPLQRLLPRLRLRLPGHHLLQAPLAHAFRHHQPGEGRLLSSCQRRAIHTVGIHTLSLPPLRAACRPPGPLRPDQPEPTALGQGRGRSGGACQLWAP